MNNKESLKSNQKFIELLKKAQGSRSLRAYALAAGVSPSSLTRIIKGEYLPKQQTIRMLTSEKAAPQNGITYLDLMVAAGYQDKFAVDIAMDFLVDGFTKDGEHLSAFIESKGSESESAIKRYKDYLTYDDFNERENRIKGILASALITKPYAVGGLTTREENRVTMNYFGSMVAYPHEGRIKSWIFDIKHSPSKLDMAYHYFLRMAGTVMIQKPKQEDKFSWVVSDRGFYDYICRYVDCIAYRGELSVILVDITEYKVVEEKYLSHYYEGDTSAEIHIV